MKKLLVLFIIVVVGFVFSASDVLAGRKQHHRWEGVAIGLGAALLGNALIQGCQEPSPAPCSGVIYYSSPPPPCGHWETKRVWVPNYKKVWNPAHYDRHGRWCAGQWITIDNGYYSTQRFWVE